MKVEPTLSPHTHTEYGKVRPSLNAKRWPGVHLCIKAFRVLILEKCHVLCYLNNEDEVKVKQV